MSKALNLRTITVCDCHDCGDQVIVIPHITDKLKYLAMWECDKCNKVVCENCYNNWPQPDSDDDTAICDACREVTE